MAKMTIIPSGVGDAAAAAAAQAQGKDVGTEQEVLCVRNAQHTVRPHNAITILRTEYKGSEVYVSIYP